MTRALPGRKREAARNDGVILEAARDVFIEDPKAPISAVAERAGVGISALYRRYPSKEDLLRTLCHDGLKRFIAEAEEVSEHPDPWGALTVFLRRVVEADVHSLTVHLAGTFTSTPEMTADAIRSNGLVAVLVDRARDSGRLRPDAVTTDVGLIMEACAAIRLPDRQRTKELRQRYLQLAIDGLERSDAGALPGPPPSPGEFSWRWAGSRQPAQRDGDA